MNFQRLPNFDRWLERIGIGDAPGHPLARCCDCGEHLSEVEIIHCPDCARPCCLACVQNKRCAECEFTYDGD